MINEDLKKIFKMEKEIDDVCIVLVCFIFNIIFKNLFVDL